MKKLLIVDDQEDVQHLLGLVLRTENLAVRHAFSGQEAIGEAFADPPDLVLLDIMMPGGIDGLEVARRLKGDERTCKAAIIFMTAKVQDEDRRAAMAAGGDAFLCKPFTLEEMRRTVARFLAKDADSGQRDQHDA